MAEKIGKEKRNEEGLGRALAEEGPDRVWRTTVLVIQFSFRARDAAYNMNDSKERKFSNCCRESELQKGSLSSE